MVILVAVVLVGLWFTAWKIPATADDLNFKRSLIALLLSMVGLGVSEAIKIFALGRNGDDQTWGTIAGGEGFGWLCLTVSVYFYFKIRRED
jgi:hypothetical protein